MTIFSQHIRHHHRMGQQEFDTLCMSIGSCTSERGVTLFVRGVDINFLSRQQEFDALCMSIGSCTFECGVAHCICYIDIDSRRCQQEFDTLCMSIGSCTLERGVALFVGHVDIDSRSSQQVLHTLRVAIAGQQEERSASVFIRGIDIGIDCKEQQEFVTFAFLCGFDHGFIVPLGLYTHLAELLCSLCAHGFEPPLFHHFLEMGVEEIAARREDSQADQGRQKDNGFLSGLARRSGVLFGF